MTILVLDALEFGPSQLPMTAPMSFALAPGEVMFLRGANGSGKSTLLRTLAGLIARVSGNFTAPERFAFCGHLDAIKGQMSVRENLAFFAQLGGGDVTEAMTCWNLTALADRLAMELSAGQRRRLSLARLSLRALPLWLLDEPSTALDQASVGLLESALARHRAAGGGALIATHLPIAAEGARELTLVPPERQPADLGELW